MTPELADIAFVLETVPGIVGVYATTPSAHEKMDDVHVIVHIEDDARTLAAAHYALLKILRHEECARISITRQDASSMQVRATRGAQMVLSAPERFAAMSRVSERAKILAEERNVSIEEEERKWKAARARMVPSLMTVLIVDEDESVATAVKEAFPAATIYVVSPAIGVKIARFAEPDLILCGGISAPGAWGFISWVAQYRPRLAEAIIIVAHQDERVTTIANLAATHRNNRCLLKPVTAESLRLVYTAPLGFEVLNVATASIASAGKRDEPPAIAKHPAMTPRTFARRALVLVVDDEPDTQALLAAPSPSTHIIRTADEWTALEKIVLNDLDLVLCNASMKVAGDKPLYRLLWNARPDIKSRFVLIIDPRRVPASVRDGRTRGSVSRPITHDTIAELLSAAPARDSTV